MSRHQLWKKRQHQRLMGGCQSYGPFLGTLNIGCRIIIGIHKKTIILTTTIVFDELVYHDVANCWCVRCVRRRFREGLQFDYSTAALLRAASTSRFRPAVYSTIHCLYELLAMIARERVLKSFLLCFTVSSVDEHALNKVHASRRILFRALLEA